MLKGVDKFPLLCYPQALMKNSFVAQNLKLFISLLVGGSGASLLILPGYLGVTNDQISIWSIFALGFLAFVSALLLQATIIWKVHPYREISIQLFSIAALVTLTGLYWNNNHYIASGALALCAIIQMVLLLPVDDRIRNIDFPSLIISLEGLAAGIYLAIAGINSSSSKVSLISLLLAIVFLLTAFIGISVLIFPTFRLSRLLQKLQILPWLGWIIFFIPTFQKENFILPASVLIILIVGDFIPWEKIKIPEGDILARRVVTTGLTIEVSLLIFLGALLYLLDPTFSNPSTSLITAREAALLFFILFSVMNYYAIVRVAMTVNGLMRELIRTEEGIDDFLLSDESEVTARKSRLEKYIRPFMTPHDGIRSRINAQTDQINVMARQVANEKKRNMQLNLLLELSQQLENQLDQPVSAQLAANTLERALSCSLAIIFVHNPENKEFVINASAGRQTSLIPTGYRQSASKGIIGRALRQRKTQIVNDTSLDPDYVYFEGETNLSAVVIPLIFNGHVNGVITLNHERVNAFGSIDIGLAETVAAELTRAWERSGYHQRLTELVQTGSQLSSALDPESAAQEVSLIAKEILQARFTYVYIQFGQDRNFIQHATSGNAPQLYHSLRELAISDEMIQLALHASQPFRIRDVRKYEQTSGLTIDSPGLRSLLTTPIRWHHVNIGAIFAFGKQNEVFFTENDESLAELLSIQAAGAFESAWLQQELRGSLHITSLLYRLSNKIILAENLEDAASDIAQTAYKLSKGSNTGIVLLNPDGSIAAEVMIDAEGKHNHYEHPMKLVQDAMEAGQMIYFSLGVSLLRTCLPIQTPIRKYGAVWMDTIDEMAHKPISNPNDLQALVNQAAIALERSLLLVESRRQAAEIKAAYDMLEATYDQTLASLTSALDARDRETEGHSLRVTHLAVKLGEVLGFPPEELKILERGSLLHDIGKIGISDTILHKPGPLNEDEWKIMKLHPDIGARIVAGIPFLEDTIPLIRHHQERWDGTGYPGALAGENIPTLARLFSIIDAFDALTSNRPYRTKISIEEALVYLQEQAGILFDPKLVDAFVTMIRKDPSVILVIE